MSHSKVWPSRGRSRVFSSHPSTVSIHKPDASYVILFIMKVAELLSDLKSLSPEVCPPGAAMKLVSVHRTLDDASDKISGSSNNDATIEKPSPKATKADGITMSNSDADDADIRRAKELVALHYDVKVKHRETGLDEELLQARHDVANILRSLSRAE